MRIRGLVAFVLLVASAVAQMDAGSTIRRVRVRVAFANGVCDYSTRVRLIGHTGLMAEANTNDQCEAEFTNIPEGTYQLDVSGQNFSSTEGTISASNGSADFEVKVKRATDPEPMAGAPAPPSVSAVDLAIPSRAQKEFDRAQGLIDRQDFNKAIQTLNRAIAIYPSYAGAYNNLGVVYARLGDRDKEREALRKAISINDHFAPAYVNLGRMNITTGDFAGAEAEFSKATEYDPTDAMTLVLLTYAEFMSRHFELAIATSHRAHSLQGAHAFAHQVAAHAYEQKHDGANAIAELELFLKEEPSGQRADIARKELVQLHAIVQRSSVRAQ